MQAQLPQPLAQGASAHQPLALTRVDANPQVQLLVGPVPDAEGLHGLQQRQGHAHDLMGVQLAVSDRQP